MTLKQRLLRSARLPGQPFMPSVLPATSFEIKSADLSLVALVLKSAVPEELARDVALQLAETPDFFDNDPVLIDLSFLRETQADTVVDFEGLIQLLQPLRLRPVAFKGASPIQREAALQAGLVEGDEARVRQLQQAPATTPPKAAATSAVSSLALSDSTALVIDKPLRSGQQVYAKGRDLVVLAMVNPGAEVIADGSIHVYAALRGKAIAGARGLNSARIFAQAMEPELISIAGVYRTSENPLPADVLGRPAQVQLQSGEGGDKLLIQALRS